MHKKCLKTTIFLMILMVLVSSVSFADSNVIMEFIKKISNIPSPTSNLKYIFQSGNKFEVKFGDGMFFILSNDTYPYRLDCSENSMLPVFSCNDNIILKKIESNKELGIGDIIVFEFSNRTMIHRIVKIDSKGYWTRADNFDNTLKYLNGELILNDPPVGFKNIKYKVVGIIYK